MINITNDPYLYSGTNILINKLNIYDDENHKEMEAEYTSLRLKQIIENPIIGDFDFKHLCEVHRWIFQDIYEWAGIPRIINIEKSEHALGGLSIEYEDYKSIEYSISITLDKLTRIKWNELTLDRRALEFSKNMAEAWKIHCFREGNTRTIVTFYCQFAEQKEMYIDRSLFEKHSVYVRNSLVAASAIFKDL